MRPPSRGRWAGMGAERPPVAVVEEQSQLLLEVEGWIWGCLSPGCKLGVGPFSGPWLLNCSAQDSLIGAWLAFSPNSKAQIQLVCIYLLLLHIFLPPSSQPPGAICPSFS